MNCPDKCEIPLEDYCRSCRCFMTGEYCSKQENIRKERKVLHNKNSINVFVIMNFSSMSDVVFKWRLQGFIESLSKYFAFDLKDGKKQKLVCCEQRNDSSPKVKLNIVRSDSNPSSNYVMCSRICQQLQIADLVVVDVSQRNTNVFYELGIAVALGKLILPICYSESFFRMEIPEKIKALESKESNDSNESKKSNDYSIMIHHIDCFPWRRTLFEYYGIRFRTYENAAKKDSVDKDNSIDDNVEYFDYTTAAENPYGFSDEQYTKFPYRKDINTSSDTENIGKKLYEILHNSYNNSGRNHNTLVVYTMDGILNEEQAGLCIINFYKNITKQMKDQQCFYGDRVGVLIQGNTISEKEKDALKNRSLLYSIGEIIHIGMNQATFTSQKAQIKPSDYLYVPKADHAIDENSKREIERFVKEYTRNKSISIYPDHPVYVQRVEKGIQYDLFDQKKDHDMDDWDDAHFFCLYHIMLQNLKCTNEVVVDISGNSIHALFWLGAAHGSDVYTIAVRHEQTEEEQRDSKSEATRPIFDISGLWTAILHSYDTEGFYRQLARVQMGIDQHTKLMVQDLDDDEESIREIMYEQSSSKIKRIFDMLVLMREKEEEEAAILESYYRSRFWKNMLRYNQLLIRLPQKNGNERPELFVEKECVEILAKFSRYLSRRTVIGEYDVEIASDKDTLENNTNYISVGSISPGKTEEEGELFRHRDVDSKRNGRAYFHVTLKNTGGDVTHSLSDALIAEPWESGSTAKTYLADMQLKKRKELIVRYHAQLKKKFQDIIKEVPKTTTNIRHIFYCAQYASEAYLSTVLYRYFLPFITMEEENRILNGMETFMRTLLMVHWNAFSREKANHPCVKKILEAVRQVLEEVLAETVSDKAVSMSEEREVAMV